MITNIKITSNLIKLKYIQNYEELDLTDGEIQVTRNNGSVEEIPINTSGVKVTGFNNQNLGEQDITVSYGGKSASFEICVTQGEIKDTTTKFIIQRQEM